jgi:hypothetical protein
MTRRQPDWDIDRALGAQAELWVLDLRKALAANAPIEVKAPQPFIKHQSFYAEYKCQGRDGIWRPSGISVTKAQLCLFKFGALPGGLIVETNWLKRAMKLAYTKPALRKKCLRGSNWTFGVLVSLAELWATRDGEP